MSDDELIEKIKGGDETAAKELIDRYYAAILRYCGWHCTVPDRAEDLTQETFYKLFQSLPRYKGRNKFKAYLYTIANRLCIDEGRKMPFYSLEDAEEIAKVMGCSMRTAQSRVRNALRLMRRESGDEG